MNRQLSSKAIQNYFDAPEAIQKAFDKQVKLLVENLRHPSLRAKKYHESGNLWQARVTKAWRFYFTIEDGGYVIQDIIKHPK